MARVAVLLPDELVARHQQALLQLDQVTAGLAQRALFHVLAQRSGQVWAARHMVEILRLHLLLVRFTVVEVVEVGDYDGHRKRDGQHTGDRTQRTNYLAPDTNRPAQHNANGFSNLYNVYYFVFQYLPSMDY